jgi:hypothetical protein
MSLPLERVTIAVVAVLLVAALVGWIKYDMQRTAPRPVTRVGMNSAPIRGAQLRPVSGCAAVSVTPTLAVADLLGRVARFQLPQRVVDRRKGHRDALVL